MPVGINWLPASLPRRIGFEVSDTRSSRVDGMLVIGLSDQDAEIVAVARISAPVVVWGQERPERGCCSVGNDNVGGGRIATERLIATRRHRVFFVRTTDIPEIAARHAGFVAACTAGGIDAGGHLATHLTGEAACQMVAEALDEGPEIDGLVAASDAIAMGAMRALAERGVSVPDSVAVIGYDDVKLAAYTSPPLTTVRQDLAGAAEHLIDMLFRRMHGGETTSISMPPRLVVRASA